MVNTTNPILVHSGEVWTKVHKANKLSHYVHKYAAICIGNYVREARGKFIQYKIIRRYCTFLHYIWECALVMPCWVSTLTPELCLLGDKSQIPNISEGTFFVIMVGLITASKII